MGDYLRAARRKRRLSIDRAAEQTRIRADYLMRMESDEFDFLAPAYVRGFLRTYARFLRVDPESLLEEFDHRYGRGRADTSQLIALDRRAKSLPRQRRRWSSWGVAASFAAIVLVALAIVGIVNEPDEQTPTGGDSTPVAEGPSEPSATPTEEPSASPTPSPTPSDSALAFTDGIEVEIVASRERCWIEVTSDGELLTPGGIILEVGDRSEVYTADKSMSIVFGYPEGVDIIVNGQDLGAPGGVETTAISIPQDIDDLL